MADPPVHITNGIPDSGTGAITTLGMTLVDGANATLGASTDAPVAAGQAGSLSAKLRSLSRDMNFGGLTASDGRSAQANVGGPSILIDQYGAYVPIAASQTLALCGSVGAQYDYLAGVLIVPSSTSPGAVTIRDGNGGDMAIFAGGASSVTDLHSFLIPLGLYALIGATPGWRITTGANVSVIAIGKFT